METIESIMVFELALLDFSSFSSALAVGPRHTRQMKNSECLLCKGPFTQNASLHQCYFSIV